MPNVEEIKFHPERNEDEWRQKVEDLLRIGNGKFHFQKVNGELRDMYCTLQQSVLPEEYNMELRNLAKPGVLTVWDIEVDAWRSLRYESVIQFKFLGPLDKDMEHESSFRESD